MKKIIAVIGVMLVALTILTVINSKNAANLDSFEPRQVASTNESIETPVVKTGSNKVEKVEGGYVVTTKITASFSNKAPTKPKKTPDSL